MRPLQIGTRVTAAIVGGWAFAWGFVTLGIALLLGAGMPYEEARTLTSLLVFLVYLAALCWAFTTASALHAWAVLAGGGAAMTALAWALLRLPH